MEYTIKNGESLSKYNSVLVEGDTVFVEAGTFGGLGVAVSGIKFVSGERRQAKTGQWYFQSGICDNIIEGFDIYDTGGSNGVNMNAGSIKRNTIRDCEIHPPGGTCGVDVANSGDDNVVEDCDIHDMHYAFHTSSGANHNNIFQRNNCWNFSGDVINVSPSAVGTKILNNILRDAADDGVHLFDDGAGQVIGNLIYNCAGVALWVNGAGGIVTKNNTVIGISGGKWGYVIWMEKGGHVFKNNIIYVDDAVMQMLTGGGSGDIDYNDWYNPKNPASPIGAHGIALDPKFVDIVNHNYTLQTGSPCKGIGEGGIDMGCTSGASQPPSEPPEEITGIKISMSIGSGAISGAVTDADGSPMSGNVPVLDNLPAGSYTITCTIKGKKVGYRFNIQDIIVGE